MYAQLRAFMRCLCQVFNKFMEYFVHSCLVHGKIYLELKVFYDSLCCYRRESDKVTGAYHVRSLQSSSAPLEGQRRDHHQQQQRRPRH